MSGEELVSKLQQLDFPSVESLDSLDLDWIFENECLQPMLEWFCHHVNTSNLLDEKQKDEYKNLSQSGAVILKGQQLNEALTNLECIQDEAITEESLNLEIKHLSAFIQQYKKQKQRLMKRRNFLSNHLTAQSHRSIKLGAVEGNVKHKYKKALEQTQADNLKMNGGLEQLTQSVTDMNPIVESVGFQEKLSKSNISLQATLSIVPSRTCSTSIFLSQVPFKEYYDMEDTFTTQLTSYTRRQFFQGISDIASSDEDSRYEILEVSDPDSLLIRGEREDINIRDCKEIARLHALYVKSESDKLHALYEMKKVKGHLQCAEGILDSLKCGIFSTETGKNRERLHRLQSAVQPVRQDLLLMSEQEVPKIFQECKDAKVQQVLTGDYNLKLGRQDYFTSNQDKVIDQLIKQRSRNEFLTMALEVELRQHRELHHLLSSVYTKLYQQYTQWLERSAVMSDNSLTPAKHKRETVDSRDKTTARLYHILDENHSPEEKQLFLTYSTLVDNASRHQQKSAGFESSLTDHQSAGQGSIHTMEKDVKMCEDLIYAGSSTTSGAPLLTPCQLQDTMLQLKDMIKKLENGIRDVLEDVENKKKILRKDGLAVQERQLFTYFFTNPAKLHKIINELSSRVQAEKYIDGAAWR